MVGEWGERRHRDARPFHFPIVCHPGWARSFQKFLFSSTWVKVTTRICAILWRRNLVSVPFRRDKRLQCHVLGYKHWNNAKKSFQLVLLVCLFVCLYLLFNVFNLRNRNKLCQIPRTSKQYYIKGIITGSRLLPISNGLGKITLTIYHLFIYLFRFFIYHWFKI